MEKWQYPQYRKLEGFQRYYCISGERSFEEVALVNGKSVKQIVQADQFPEMLRIKDMLACEWKYVPMSDEEITAYFPDGSK